MLTETRPKPTIQPGAKIYTVEDYMALTDEYPRYELLEGELIEMVSPTSRHQIVSANLFRILDHHCRSTHQGILLTAPLDVIFSKSVVMQPDLIFVAEARRAEIIRERIIGAPDLVIEILSPTSSQRDLNQKRKLYARHGVAEYWIVDPDDETIEIQRRQGNLLSTISLFEKNQTLTSPTFPGLTMEAAQAFAE
jgi:Uma2 family endonuclease